MIKNHFICMKLRRRRKRSEIHACINSNSIVGIRLCSFSTKVGILGRYA